jgi:Domain of unknown function (DUF4149)
MVLLRYVALLALVVWVGGLVALGAIAAPATFDVVALRHVSDGRLLAGAIFGEILRRFFLVSCAAGLVLLVSLTLRRILGPRPRHVGIRVAGRIRALQSTMTVAPSSLPETDPRRVEFARLHVISTTLQLVPLLGGLALIFWELKE